MKSKKSVDSLKLRLKNLKENDFYNYFPSLIDDLEYIWNGLVDEMETFTKEDLINNNLKINKLVMQYIMEVLKIYTKELFQIEIKYDFDEVYVLGGCAAYDDKNNRILLAAMGMILQAINTSSYIQPPMHEFRHQLHHSFYKQDSIDEILKYPDYFINVAKHNVYSKGQSGQFYFDCYNELYPEVDAEEYGLSCIKDLIPSLLSIYKREKTPPDELTEKIERLQEQLLDDYDELKEDLTERKRVSSPISEELYTASPIKSTFSVDKDSLIAVDKYLKNNPQLLVENPILRFVYGENRPKYYHEWIKEKQEQLQRIPNNKIKITGEEKESTTHNQINEIYGNIIKTDPMLQVSEYLVKGNIEELKEFIKFHPTLIDEYQEELEELLRLYGTDEDSIRLLKKDKPKEKRKDLC